MVVVGYRYLCWRPPSVLCACDLGGDVQTTSNFTRDGCSPTIALGTHDHRRASLTWLNVRNCIHMSGSHLTPGKAIGGIAMDYPGGDNSYNSGITMVGVVVKVVDRRGY